MLCEKCGQKEATVRFVKIENNNQTELHLCQSCAQGYTGFSVGFDLQNILSNLFQQGPLQSKIKEKEKTCPVCGLSLGDVQKSGRLGCSQCYETFQKELSPVLRRVHGSTIHNGKIPARGYTQLRMGRKIEEVKRKLEECIRTENYEQAAHYRDEIRNLEQKLAQGGKAHEEGS